MKIIETTRCIIRSFEENDIENLAEYRNNEEWMKYQGFKNLTEKEYKEKLLVPFNVERGSQLAIALKETNQLIGDLYLHKESNEISLGYTIAPKYSRKGYMSEVIDALIKYLLEEYPNIRIKADTDSDNIPSINFLKRVGFERIKSNDAGVFFEYKQKKIGTISR